MNGTTVTGTSAITYLILGPIGVLVLGVAVFFLCRFLKKRRKVNKVVEKLST